MRHLLYRSPYTGTMATLTSLALLVLSLFSVEVATGDDVAAVTAVPSASPKQHSVGRLAEPDRELEDVEVETQAAMQPVSVSGSSERARGHSRMFISDPFVHEILSGAVYKETLKLLDQTNKPAIIMLYSAWCPHCFSYRNTFSRLAADLHEKFHFAALNCMENEGLFQTCADLGIFALPSIKLFVPVSIHAKLPQTDRQPKPINTPAGHLFWELLESQKGGLLDSFDEAGPYPMAIHSLGLPSSEIYAAIQYAAEQTMQNISRTDLRLTLKEDTSAIEQLEGKPCQLLRWKSEEPPSSGSGFGSQRKTQATEKAAETLVNARVHDAIRGLQYVLASWVMTPSDRLTRADEFALIDLLEVVRATIPLKAVKRSAALAILHLYNSNSGEVNMQKVPPTVVTQRAVFSEVFQLYDKLDEILQETKGMQTANWHQWIGRLPFGEGAPALPSLEEPELKHCTSITCSVWMLLHLMAEGAANLADRVSERRECGIEEVFFKRKAQALPIYLLREQQAKGKGFAYGEVLKIASKDTADLVDYNPLVGCMTIPSFDVAYSIFNVLRRFFGCTACRQHFRIQFDRRTHGLDKLEPPEGVYTLSTPVPNITAGHDESSLLEEYRSQENGSMAPWAYTREEKGKLKILKLWLWRLHNAVNVRTAADSTLAFAKGDKDASNYANCDVRWPPKSACMKCRDDTTPGIGAISPDVLLARDSNPDILAIEEEVSDFDEASVLDYLKKSYWPKAFHQK